MEQIKPDMNTTKHSSQRFSKSDPEDIAYVRIDQQGKVTAVFGDDSEMDVSELLTLSISDD